MATLSIESVSIGALQNIRLKVMPGEVLCLSGPSGSGKSRLLRSIADLEPHGGTVQFGEINQSEVPAHHWRRSVMMVPAESAWWFDTVGEHLGGEHLGETPADMLHALGFPDGTSSWTVERLSSGEKQRLALIRALGREPQALLLDEPTANLDEDSTRKVENWLRSLIRERQLAVIWVAHREDQIARVADRHYHIEGTRLVQRELER